MIINPYIFGGAPSSLLTNLYAVYKAESNSLASLTTSLYAVYKAESNANDSLATYNGTAQGGLTYSTGKSGNAFTFNGTNAYVSLPNNSLKFTNDFSISVWTNFSGISNDAQTILSNLTYDGTYAYGYFFYYHNQYLKFVIYNNSGAVSLDYSTSILFNSWNNIVITRKLSTGTKMYINGTLVASNSSVQNPNYHATMAPSIGAANYGPTYGNLVQYYMSNGSKSDEVNVWNKELTSTEVTELYNTGTGKFYQNNAFYSTIVNDSLATYNGTAQGGLTYSTGKSGNAFTFNGTNAYVSLPTNQFNFTGDFTISAWVNISGLYIGTNVIHLMTNLNCDGAWFQNLKGIWFQISGQALALSLLNNGTANDVTWNDTTGSIIKSGSGWFHVVTTRKGGTASKLYVNGVLKNSNTNTLDANFHTNYQTPVIGNNRILNRSGAVATSDVYAPSGVLIDEYNVWNKELTSTEVTELYNTGTGKFYPY